METIHMNLKLLTVHMLDSNNNNNSDNYILSKALGPQFQRYTHSDWTDEVNRCADQ